MSSTPITFIHLSDIHFRYAISNGPYDLDEVIRNELLIDAEAEAQKLSGVYGVLVTGDVAFGGERDEYNTAYDWLAILCERIKCSFKNVWTVPGNHDVDRKKVKGNPLAEMLRHQLRDVPLNALNGELMKHLESPQSRELLFGPLEQYNLFAAKLGNCLSTPNPLFWEHSLTLPDSSTLRLRGLNSVIISDENDHDEEARLKLLLSSFQTKFLRAPGVIHLTMCHHPLEWLRDHYEVEEWLDVHARVQLFGHRHTQRVKQVADNIRVAAGAMHPDRGEPGWEPRYNFISLQTKQDDRGRRLRVEVHPRVWNDTAKAFLQDSLGVFSRELPLPDWQPVSLLQQNQAVLTDHEDLSSVVAAIKSDLVEIEDRTAIGEMSILNAGEKLTSRYMSLPRRLRVAIANDLSLSEETDEGISETELYKRYFRRAKERRLLEKLWNEVETVYVKQGDEPSPENPFAGS